MSAAFSFRSFFCIAVLFCIFCVSAPAAEVLASGPVLTKVVVVSRHGVRSPTQARHTLEEWSARKWPQWPAPRGHLTARGAWLVNMQWSVLGSWFREKGLLPQGCPHAGDIWVHADVDQRTRATAKAVLDGLASGCGLPYVYSGQDVDAVFHPLKAGLCALDEQRVRRDILLDSGGLRGLERDLGPALALINKIAGPAAPKLCAQYGVKSPCFASALPSRLVFSPKRDKTGINGGLGIASSLAEIWLLEYAQWPDALPAWGRGSLDVMETVMPVHMRVFNAVNRAESVAKSQSAMLASRILDALGGTGDHAAAAARVVVFVGHDTNLANIGGMLGLTWKQPGYAPDQTPPGGALMFTLWTLPGGLKRLGIQFVSLSLEGLRATTPEQVRKAVQASPVSWEYCIAKAHEFPGGDALQPASDPFMPKLHSPEAFFRAARRSLDMKCLDAAPEDSLLIGR